MNFSPVLWITGLLPDDGCTSKCTVCLFIPTKGKRIKISHTVQIMKEGTENVKAVLPQIFIFCKSELDHLLPSKDTLAECEVPKEDRLAVPAGGNKHAKAWIVALMANDMALFASGFFPSPEWPHLFPNLDIVWEISSWHKPKLYWRSYQFSNMYG